METDVGIGRGTLQSRRADFTLNTKSCEFEIKFLKLEQLNGFDLSKTVPLMF